jgi:hypothetical protein
MVKRRKRLRFSVKVHSGIMFSEIGEEWNLNQIYFVLDVDLNSAIIARPVCHLV